MVKLIFISFFCITGILLPHKKSIYKKVDTAIDLVASFSSDSCQFGSSLKINVCLVNKKDVDTDIYEPCSMFLMEEVSAFRHGLVVELLRKELKSVGRLTIRAKESVQYNFEIKIDAEKFRVGTIPFTISCLTAPPQKVKRGKLFYAGGLATKIYYLKFYHRYIPLTARLNEALARG